MKQNKQRVSVLCLLLVITTSLCAQTTWNRVSSLVFDWDGHKGVQVILEITKSWNDPGDFTRIRIRVPGRTEFVLANQNGWVKYRSDVASISKHVRTTVNPLGSEYVLAWKAGESRRVLLLFGYSYASSPGSLDVLEIAPSGEPRVVFHRDEFGLTDMRDLDGDGIAEIIGYPCLSQGFGNGLLTYDPFNVYKLGVASATAARLSLPLSKAYNLENYYGWAGARCSEDIAVILHPPKGGKPMVMPTKEAEKIVGNGR